MSLFKRFSIIGFLRFVFAEDSWPSSGLLTHNNWAMSIQYYLSSLRNVMTWRNTSLARAMRYSLRQELPKLGTSFVNIPKYLLALYKQNQVCRTYVRILVYCMWHYLNLFLDGHESGDTNSFTRRKKHIMFHLYALGAFQQYHIELRTLDASYHIERDEADACFSSTLQGQVNCICAASEQQYKLNRKTIFLKNVS